MRKDLTTITHTPIYLDNAATTAISPNVLEAMTKQLTDDYGNPSSLHHFGRKANQRLRDYRETIAQALDVSSRHIIFTSGGSESDNFAIKGYALAHQDKGKHLITTAIEHHAVLETMHYLEKRFGFEVTYLPATDGHITPEQVQEALREDTILVSMMYANNETGDLLPIKVVGELLSTHQAAFHVDAVQAFGKIAISPKELGIDLLSASAHKYHGPKGVGFLYVGDVSMDKFIHGGDQEDKRRASTENMVGIAGMAEATKEAYAHLEENYLNVTKLKNHFLQELDSLGVHYYLNSSAQSLPHLINIGFRGQHNGLLLTQLDLAGFAVSTGSACTAGAVTPSHVLASYFGDNSPRLHESIRISLSELNTKKELSLLAKTLRNIIGN
ncbi:cysteine desulfurase family protein [Streptococcus sp. zg-JUN1979]|uniref:cysteine desulfurase family protein n=1 Tax=Streptococcus sp. zg-JUN1979 TaxID=3391450 RepID=UPI0039A728C8